MPWARLDDAILDNPKIIAVGPIGLLLHVAAITWCARNLTDGHVPTSKVTALIDLAELGTDGHTVARRCVDAGLWEPCPGGFTLHDYLDYNPSRADVLAERERSRTRKAASAARRHAGNHALNHTVNHGGSNAVSSDGPVPVPVLTPPKPPPTRGGRDLGDPSGETRAPRRRREPTAREEILAWAASKPEEPA